MPTEPYGWTIFCDDIRAEIGGKFSYMGVYDGTMYIPAKEFPAMLPKLALSIHYRIAIDDARLEDVNIAIFLPGDEKDKPSIITVIPISEMTMDAPARPGDGFREFGANIMLGPLTLKEKGRIRVRAMGGAGPVKLGSLNVDLRPVPVGQHASS